MASSTARNRASLRIYVLAGAFLIWGFAICARLVYLQIFAYGKFEQRAQHQQQRSEEVSAPRGNIFDRNGQGLAMSIKVDSVFAVPGEMPKPAATISLIARITRQDPRELVARCVAARTFCWLARKPDPEISARVRALNLRGVYFQKEAKRYYPKGELAAQVLGYVGMDGTGLSGIEREFEDQLHGRAGQMLVSVDARRKWFASVEKQPAPGENVVLTLDDKIQYIAERELEAAIAETHAVAGTVVVENPRTGEILALANRPTFNPNLSKEITPEKLKNHAVSDIYEPGSTFKLVTLSAALEEKLTHPSELVDCQMGSIVFNGMRIRDSRPHGLLTVSDVLAESSDVGSIKIGMRLGDARFYKYIRAFGFGQQTGIELPGETRGLTKPPSRWSKVSIAAISMGQEIGITPLQLAGLISAMANDGIYVAPRIVAATTQPQGGPQTIAFHPVNEHRVLSAFTAAEMRQMMQAVVLHGTGTRARLVGYSAAGKTGTAQKVDPLTHAYSHTKYVASFAGFAPVNNPAITIAVVLDSALGPHQGGQVCAPVFNRIAQQVLEYLHTPHDLEIPTGRQVLVAQKKINENDLEEGSPDHPGDPIDLADAGGAETSSADGGGARAPAAGPAKSLAGEEPSAALREDGQDVSAVTITNEAIPPATGDESARRAWYSARPPERRDGRKPTPQPENGTVVLDVEQGGIVVPSFIGKSVRTSIELAESTGLELDVVGSGRAEDQSPAPGAHVPSGARIMVRFGRE